MCRTHCYQLDVEHVFSLSGADRWFARGKLVQEKQRGPHTRPTPYELGPWRVHVDGIVDDLGAEHPLGRKNYCSPQVTSPLDITHLSILVLYPVYPQSLIPLQHWQ